MLNNIGLPGLILLSPMLIAMVMGIYSLAKVPNYDDKFNYAGFWLRFIAALIDGILMTLITLIPAFALGYLVGSSMAGTSSSYEIEATTQALGNLLGFVVGWLYYTLLESSKYQATLGKKMLGLRVVDLDGRRIGFGKANGRYFGKLLSLFTLLIGHFMMGWTKKKQALYDKMAGCLVVRNSSPALSEAQSSEVNGSCKEPAFESRTDFSNNSFEAEALRKYRAGDIDEETMMKLINSNSR
tara:strand:- start:654 stop:1376 length:723 start_codon:yes stop_codon:yes gene_type:complete